MHLHRITNANIIQQLSLLALTHSKQQSTEQQTGPRAREQPGACDPPACCARALDRSTWRHVSPWGVISRIRPCRTMKSDAFPLSPSPENCSPAFTRSTCAGGGLVPP